MSVEPDGGAPEVWSVGHAPRDADRQVITNLYDTYAVQLFDYCEGILRNRAAAADAVQDTLVTADVQISKLRDPGRLRVWLYCIARRQCLSELPRGSETITPEDLYAEQPQAPDADIAEFEFPDAEAEARDRETLQVITAALDGLSDSDYELVSLVFRHGIEGEDLATVLELSSSRAQAMLAGASTRFEESADAIMVLRAGWTACRALEAIAGDWDPAAPVLTPEFRKRLSRHISSCGSCTGNRGEHAFGPELLGALPMAVPPAALREQVTKTAFDTEPGSYRRTVARRAGNLDDHGFPAPPQVRRNLPRAAAAAAAIVVLSVAGVTFHQLTSASAVGSNPTAATVATGSPTPASASSSVSSPIPSRTHRHRHSRAPVPSTLGPSPSPGGWLPFPTPTPSGQSPSPEPTHSSKPSPKPTHSKSPSPSPSPTKTSPSPSPSPSPSTTSPTPTPTGTPSP